VCVRLVHGACRLAVCGVAQGLLLRPHTPVVVSFPACRPAALVPTRHRCSPRSVERSAAPVAFPPSPSPPVSPRSHNAAERRGRGCTCGCVGPARCGRHQNRKKNKKRQGVSTDEGPSSERERQMGCAACGASPCARSGGRRARGLRWCRGGPSARISPAELTVCCPTRHGFR
jgi:hypothetical protein